MKANLNEIWELIHNLTLEEKKIIYKRMEKEINSKLLYLLDKINERSENDTVPLEDITKEVEEVRGKRYGEN